MSSSYHLQSDGQTELLNQTLDFLWCFINACPSKWIWLPLAEFWYNSCPHSTTGLSPFVAIYGYAPKHFGISDTDSVVVPELSVWLQERQVMNDLIRQHLHRSKLRMKKQADQNRSERQFAVDDMVFVKLQPYVQSSLTPRSNLKVSFKYFGPYRVLSRIGQVAYLLDLPSSYATHPVFMCPNSRKWWLPLHQLFHLSIPSDIELPRILESFLQHRVR